MAASIGFLLMAHAGVHATSSEDSTYNFLAIADWGDDGAGQKAAAIGLGVIAEQIEAKQVFVRCFCCCFVFVVAGIDCPLYILFY